MAQVIEIADMQNGANFWYGLRSRPSGLGCHPNNITALISNELALKHFGKIQDVNDVRHGAIAYSSSLSAEQVNSFELVDLNNREKVNVSQDLISILNNTLNIMLDWYSSSLNNPRDVRDLLNEIETDGYYLLRRAYKEMPVFIKRKQYPAEFSDFKKLIQSITPTTFIQHVKQASKLKP